MNVHELITELRKYRDDLPVYVRGYEDGVNDIDCIHAGRFTRDVYLDGPNYYGVHEERRDENGPVNGIELQGSNPSPN